MKNSFDKNNVVLRFPVISDLHIMGSGQETSKKLQKVYEICKREINPNAIMFAGDITDFGLREQIEEFKNITCCNFDLEKTKLFFCIGNHELYNNEILKAPLRVSEDFKEIFGDVVYYGATTDEIKASLHHASICGFDFIAMNAYKYSGGVDYRDEDIFWLEETLKKITDKNPNKPIFICGHAMIIGTNWGSDYGDYWAGSKLYNVFKKYPQVIYFAGHLHFPLQNEKTIWQKEFTTCGTSSIYFSSLEDKNEENLQYND
ncbi:MAG: metallophosphoesterase, partial [Clostridia bacterium]